MCLNLFCTLSGIELFVIIREFGIRKTHSHVDMNTLVQARRSVIVHPGLDPSSLNLIQDSRMPQRWLYEGAFILVPGSSRGR